MCLLVQNFINLYAAHLPHKALFDSCKLHNLYHFAQMRLSIDRQRWWQLFQKLHNECAFTGRMAKIRTLWARIDVVVPMTHWSSQLLSQFSPAVFSKRLINCHLASAYCDHVTNVRPRSCQCAPHLFWMGRKNWSWISSVRDSIGLRVPFSAAPSDFLSHTALWCQNILP